MTAYLLEVISRILQAALDVCDVPHMEPNWEDS